MGLQTLPPVLPRFRGEALTSSGVFTVPQNVNQLDLILIGGGRGGNGESTSASVSDAQPDAGAGGAIVFQKNFPVTPGQLISYTIGAGGAGGTNPAPSPSVGNPGNAGGNTVFGLLVAPGGKNRVGNFQITSMGVNENNRGALDFATLDQLTFSSGVTSNNFSPLGGAGIIQPGYQFIGAGASSTTSVVSAKYPAITNLNSSTYSNTSIRFGLTTTFDKLLSFFTPSAGGSASLNELVANTSLPGWGGFGGAPQVLISGSRARPAFHGGGEGGNLNTVYSGQKTSNGGNAATNSGAGGGGGAASTGNTTVAGCAGGNGGSGIIFVGYTF